MCAAMLSLIPPLASTMEIEPLQMPVIDFSMLHRANDRSSVIKDIAMACREIGYFQVCSI